MSNLVEVKIPTNANPFTVTVNGKKYSYPAGATVMVPPEVAEVIEQIGRGPNLPPSSGGGGSGGGADLLNEKGIIKKQYLPENFPYKAKAMVSGDTLTWDGNTDGLVSMDAFAEMLGTFYKISDAVPTLEDCISGATYTIAYDGKQENRSVGYDEIAEMSGLVGCLCIGDFTAVVAPENNFQIEVEGVAAIFPEAGLYTNIGGDALLTSLTIPGYTGFVAESETVTKIGKEYLPDGYPYSEMGIGTILPETTITPDENGAAALTDALGLVEGQTYTVNWNGTDFECVCVKAEMDGDGDGVVDMPLGVALGNVGFTTGGDDTGEPFVIVEPLPEFAAQVGAPVMVQALDGSTEGTVSIFGMTEVVTPMDKKYLGSISEPFVVVFEGSLDALSGQYYPDKASKTYSQVMAAVNSHQPIFAYSKMRIGEQTRILGLSYSTISNTGTDNEQIGFHSPVEGNYYPDANQLRLEFNQIIYYIDGSFDSVMSAYDVSATKL